MDILVIGDVHTKVKVSNERLTWLANLVLDRQPEVIVQLGDWADMTSLCTQIKGKKSYEGQRYAKDIEAAIEGQETFFAPINAYNRNRSRKYSPKLYMTLGNHDNRCDREVEFNPMLEGVISTKDLQYDKYGWTVIPYLKPLEVQGITFQHYFTSGTMDKSIGGINQARTILNKMKGSCIQGHSHLLDISNEVTVRNNRLWAIVAGCYMDHKEDYVSDRAQAAWWRGVLYLSNCENGDFDLETISLSNIKKNYK